MKRFLQRTALLDRRAWNFSRILRVSVGGGVMIAGLVQQDWLPALFGSWFLYQGIFNTACCGPNGCEVPQRGTIRNDAGD